MTGAKIEYHRRADITLKSKEDGSSITVIVTGMVESSISYTAWPILEQIGSIGSVMGDFLPISQSTSIRLKDSYGAIGFERRFSDLLERYTIIDQQVAIYIAACPIGSFSTSDYELRWVGVVKNVDKRRDSLTLNIAGRGIKDRTLNLMLGTDTFPSIPESSVGYALPIVIGSSIQVKPIRVAADGDSSPEYVYSTTLGTQHPVSGITTYYLKDSDGEYQPIVSAGTTNNPIFENTSSNTAGLLLGYQIAYELNQEALRYGVRGGRLSLQGSGTVGAVSGQLTIQLCEADTATGAPNDSKILAQTSIDKSQYSADYSHGSGSAHQFYVDFSWNTVIPTKRNHVYYLLLAGSNETGASSTNPSTQNGSSLRRWKRVPGTDLSWAADTNRSLRVEMYGVVFTETKSSSPNAQGLGYAQLEITQLSAATGQTNPDLTKMDMILSVNGITDDLSGTVTGTPSFLIESPQHATELLTKEFNGSTWTGGQFGTEHSSTWNQVNDSTARFFRKLGGKTTGTTKLSQFLEQICKATASRITMHPSASTPLGYWAWGGAQDVVDDFNQDEIEVVRSEILGTETIINSVELFYAERLTPLDYVTGSALGEFKSFSARYNSTYSGQDGYAECAEVSSISRAIFGARNLETRTQPWLNDSVSARNLAISLVRRFPFPMVMHEIELPYLRAKAVKMLDVVRVTHPMLAAFFGTTPKASKAVYATDGVEVDISTGFHWARAKATRCLVEGVTTFFDSENTPRVRLTLMQVNSPHDPT